jgi:hypothetical protein
VKHPYTTANRAVWLAHQFLKASTPSESNDWAGRAGIFPAHLAQHSGMTRLESELALQSLCLFNPAMAIRRRDGRFFLTEKGRNG